MLAGKQERTRKKQGMKEREREKLRHIDKCILKIGEKNGTFSRRQREANVNVNVK